MSSHIQLLQLLHLVSVLHYLLPAVNSSWDSPKPIYVYKCLVLPSVLSSHLFLKTTRNEQQRSARSLHVNCISHCVIHAVTKRAVFEDLCCITAFSLMWCHSSSPDEDCWIISWWRLMTSFPASERKRENSHIWQKTGHLRNYYSWQKDNSWLCDRKVMGKRLILDWLKVWKQYPTNKNCWLRITIVTHRDQHKKVKPTCK